ncbi:hypothetical protein DdX_03324 [Ditylenchus destructor]|uniref:Uncharacterized protein n=1 Tax=Ditylenchus destructor TaxID=166010 RepID=A0AAD4RCY0_9BILA|nr:hypothetical protein DdX_03324 [Ditylenchus destructor]
MVTLNYYVSGWAAAGSGFGQIAIGGGSGRQPLRSSDVSLLWGAGNICSFVGPSVPAVKCYYLGFALRMDINKKEVETQQLKKICAKFHLYVTKCFKYRKDLEGECLSGTFPIRNLHQRVCFTMADDGSDFVTVNVSVLYINNGLWVKICRPADRGNEYFLFRITASLYFRKINHEDEQTYKICKKTYMDLMLPDPEMMDMHPLYTMPASNMSKYNFSLHFTFEPISCDMRSLLAQSGMTQESNTTDDDDKDSAQTDDDEDSQQTDVDADHPDRRDLGKYENEYFGQEADDLLIPNVEDYSRWAPEILDRKPHDEPTYLDTDDSDKYSRGSNGEAESTSSAIC